MVKLERLLDALARQLPSNVDKASIATALREAAKALPESQAKTKARLLRTEEACVDELESRLRAVSTEVTADGPPGEDAHEAARAVGEREDEDIKPALAVYEGVDDDDPSACAAHCHMLLKGALKMLRPAARAEEALDGLLAFLPSEHYDLSVDLLEHYMQLVPSAFAALGGSETMAWQRFLGFVLTSPMRLADAKKDGVAQDVAKEISLRLGGLIAIVAGPATARAALRHGLSNLGDATLSKAALACIAPGVFIVLRAGYGVLDAFSPGLDITRSDLLALLHTLRYIGLCRKMGACAGQLLGEATDLLRSALERQFDLTALTSELQNIGIVTSKRLRPAQGSSKNRNAANKTVAEAIILKSAALTTSTISRLVDCSGLPAGDEEETDHKAIAARARGDLFFEDVSGNVDANGVGAEAAEDGLLAEVKAKVATNNLVQLDGIEDLGHDDDSQAMNDGEGGTKKGKKKRKRPMD